MIVDDSRSNLMIMGRLAGQLPGCEVVMFASAKTALAAARDVVPDLILVDYHMPQMDGVRFIEAIRDDEATAEVPVVMVTGESDPGVRQVAISAGATDFLTKPVDPAELTARLGNLLALRRAAQREKRRALSLAEEVAAATRTIAEREEEIIMRLVRAIDIRDGATGAHVDRMARHSQMIGQQLGLSSALTRELYLSAPMHDLGKLGIPDVILKKAGPLTDDERLVMQQHTVRGHAILANSAVPLLQSAADIALSHHERFDGLGYPYGLAGDEIPLSARIVAIADVFDALVSQRPYKAAWTTTRAIQYIAENGGTRFDPTCVSAFLTIVSFKEEITPCTKYNGHIGTHNVRRSSFASTAA